MTDSTPEAAKPQTQNDRQNALAQIQFASIVDPDLTPSEEDDPIEDKVLQLETVQSAIGVSIGQQQTRLTSPKTPAAEKAAALDDTDGGVLFDGWQLPQDGTMEQDAPPTRPAETSGDGVESRSEVQAQTQEPEQINTEGPATSQDDDDDDVARLPSPWRSTPRKFQQVDDGDHRVALRSAFATGSRRRAHSGGSATESFKKYLPFSLPSMPKTSNLLNFSLPSFSVSSFDSGRARSPAPIQRKRGSSMYLPLGYKGIVQSDGSNSAKPDGASSSTLLPRNEMRQQSTTDPIPQGEFELGPDPVTNRKPTAPKPSRDLQARPIPMIRRSNSEGSLMMYRSRSFASSLGDDSRFENVSEQVNSRLKAIKDSWQDANFKLPSLPTMPNFSFGSREDLFRYNRNGSRSPRPFISDSPSNSRVSFLASSTSGARGPSPRGVPKAKDSYTDLAGMTPANAATHPYFTRALQDLTGDLVVLGGYRGSILRSAEAPNRQLWVPFKVGLNLRKVDLELGLNPEDEETEEQRIIPDGMLTNIGPVDIGRRLLKRLRASENVKNGTLRVHNYGYDWRLSPHILSRRLAEFLKSLPCNQPDVPPEKRGAIVLAHSLGGLLTRHTINQNPDLVAGVVYAGVPQTCVNILGPLRNGDDVLLSSRVLTAQVNFTIRTSFALLPLDGKCFINKKTKEEYPVDFFDVNTWEEYRLTPCLAPPLPHPNASPPLTSVSGLLNAMSNALPSLPGRKYSMSKGGSNSSSTATSPNPAQTTHNMNGGPVRDTANTAAEKAVEGGTGMAPQMGGANRLTAEAAYNTGTSQSNPATTVTIPYDKAKEYLTRTLAEIKQFKQDLAHRPEHTASNKYPPIALIYGKSTPTVYGAKVDSREAIKRADAYDELAFASGDGVVLARAAMVPPGYSVVRGGVVSSDRGHVTMLGDLEAVGKCLSAVVGARKNGVGLGLGNGKEDGETGGG